MHPPKTKKCLTCLQDKEITEFYKNRTSFANKCKSCMSEFNKANRKPQTDKRRKYNARYRETEKNKEYMKQWRAKNRKDKKYHLKRDNEKRRITDAIYREKNREKIKEYSKKRMQIIKETNPGKYIVQRLRNSMKRISRGEKSISAMELCGVDDPYHFFMEMSSKTDNPNWHKENYATDHIWQIHWFDEYSSIHYKDEDFREFLKLINHHENLRPLPFEVNSRRSFFDFIPLKEEDLKKYEPYLNHDIKEKIKWFFDHRESFPNTQLNQGDELDRFLRYLDISKLDIAPQK